MKLIKLMLILVMVIVGLVNRRHFKPPTQPDVRPRTHAPQAAVNKEILQNAERLTETLRRCKQTAQSNKETK